MRIKSKWGRSIFLTDRNRRELEGNAVLLYKEVDGSKVRAGDATIVKVEHDSDGGVIFTLDIPDELTDFVLSSSDLGAVSFEPAPS